MNGVQRPYDLVQGSGWSATGTAFNVRVPIVAERVGVWEKRYAHAWMMVWGAHPP